MQGVSASSASGTGLTLPASVPPSQAYPLVVVIITPSPVVGPGSRADRLAVIERTWGARHRERFKVGCFAAMGVQLSTLRAMVINEVKLWGASCPETRVAGAGGVPLKVKACFDMLSERKTWSS
jgi:hypothetical protein